MPNFRLPVLAAALLLVIQDAALAAVTTCGAAGTCKHIEASISADSAVMYLADTFEFGNDTHHWMSSSSQIPACVLEAGSSEDLSVAVGHDSFSQTPAREQSTDGSGCLDEDYRAVAHALRNHVRRARLQPWVFEHNWCSHITQAVQPGRVLQRQLNSGGWHRMGKDRSPSPYELLADHHSRLS